MPKGQDSGLFSLPDIAALVIALGVGGGYFAYQKHIDNQIIEGAYPAVKNTSLRVTNAMKLVEASNITYKELFERIEADIAEIDKRILDIQTASSPSTEKWMNSMAAYLRSAQELLRAEKSTFRKQMMVSSALDHQKRTFERLRNSSKPYEMKYLLEAASDARTDTEKKVVEARTAANDWVNRIDAFMQARDEIATFVPADSLVDSVVLANTRKVVGKFADLEF